ncbi:hypothetical protein HN784_01945 [bacterium]|jgi:hypothetical protein|nr:hypothetical protein [bacterium]MBT4251055.1 hypothetical protein [bacterium]MBT4597960.1 hypothetical protein [bacterium]MBT6753471.1 hypothetical protein [bacterium]MBT7038002.1 hypothetical protein [bacterium]
MKKLFVTLAMTLSIMMTFGTIAMADCPDNCPEPEPITSFECPDGECNGGFVNGFNDGSLWGETNIDSLNQVWGEGCTSLEIGTLAGAPTIGTAAITNVASQSLEILKERADGTGGIKIQDVTTASLDTLAENGGLEGGRVFSDNHMRANLTADTWDTGLTANMQTGINMAGLVCATPGTIGSLDSQVLNNSYQTTDNGAGIMTTQQSQMLGTLKINVNPAP